MRFGMLCAHLTVSLRSNNFKQNTLQSSAPFSVALWVVSVDVLRVCMHRTDPLNELAANVRDLNVEATTLMNQPSIQMRKQNPWYTREAAPAEQVPSADGMPFADVI